MNHTASHTAINSNRSPRRLLRSALAVMLLVGSVLVIAGPTQTASASDANLVPIVPARLLDTRPGTDITTVDNQFRGAGKVRARTFVELTVAGRGGIAADADAVMLNLTVIGPEAPGHFTVYPCTPTVPTASNLNFSPGQVRANSVLAKLSSNGKVCIFTHATAHIAVDANGYVPAGGAPFTVDPARLIETRRGQAHLKTIDGLHQGVGRARARQTIEFQVIGRGGVPATADAVFLNVTAISPNAPGHLTVFPCGRPVPGTSNVNYLPGDVTPNLVLATIGTNGKVCINTHADVDLIADVAGYLPPGGSRVAIEPARCADTRIPNGRTFDGQFQGRGPIAAGGTYQIKIAGRCGVANDASAVYINATAVLPNAHGHLTIWPCDTPRPNASNVNYIPGDVRPNAALAKISLDGNGRICVYTHARTDLLVDVTGYVPVAALRGITDIAPGIQHACALINTGDVNCWGGSDWLGNGQRERSYTPRRVLLSRAATDIATSDRHTCAVLDNRTAACWGDNRTGALGDGTNEGVGGFKLRLAPVAVRNLTGVTDIATGIHHTCATTNDGKVWCWGDNGNRQLGDGTTEDRLLPVEVTGLPAGTKAIQVGASRTHSCALLDDGTVACWGHGGRLGIATTGSASLPPQLATGITTATAISVGESHTCARLANGTVACWGLNNANALGPGAVAGVLTPSIVTGITGATAISAGWNSTCATLANGTARCWGANTYGQLGNGATTPGGTGQPTPVQMTGFTGALTVARTGFNFSCAVLADATAVCYGYNPSGQLGGGAGPHSTTPVVVGSERGGG